jgi:Zn-dependent metalloprotease
MLDAIRLRGNAKQIKMVAALEKQAIAIRDKRQAHCRPGIEPAVVFAADAKLPKPNRSIHDGQHKATLPGPLARNETTGATNDKQVNEAFVGSGDVFNMYLKAFGRNSLDGNGLKMISTVHHRRNLNNAFWNGVQMAYGDGDGVLFKPLTGSLSVIGHELSHGVVQFSGGLIYQDQSGALNESLADVFGALTVQFKKKQEVHEADWLIGDDILGPDINGVALRSMKAPGRAYSDAVLGQDPQPYHMDFYNNTSRDNGGVHINSGIPNHAFYLLSLNLGGNAWEKAGQIWYDAMQSINNPHATFFDWALKTLDTAEGLFGKGSSEAVFTRRAWKLVGVDI